MKQFFIWGSVILVVLTTLGFLGYAATPNYTSKSYQTHQFILNKPFNSVLKDLTLSDTFKTAALMNNGDVVYQENASKNLDVHNLDEVLKLRRPRGEKRPAPEWDFRKTDLLGLRFEGTILHFVSDIRATKSNIDVNVKLREPNRTMGVDNYECIIKVAPTDEGGTKVVVSLFLQITRKCPSSFQEYMDKEVEKNATNQVTGIERLFRYVTGG